MQVDKSFLRLKFIKKRRKLYSKKIFFPFEKIFLLIKKNFFQKKISIAGYYPSDFEVNILHFLNQAEKKQFKIGLPVIGKNYKGGIISPGIKLSLNTLSDKASLIPKINLKNHNFYRKSVVITNFIVNKKDFLCNIWTPM